MNDESVLSICSRCFAETAGENAPRFDVRPGLIRILRIEQVSAMTGLGRAMIYQLQAERRFPQSIRITGRVVGWVEAEIQQWLAVRIRECRHQDSGAAGGAPRS